MSLTCDSARATAGLKLGTQPVERRRDGRHPALGDGGLVRLPLPLEQRGAKNQRHEIGRIEAERALDRFLFVFLGRSDCGR